jgi:hypothetical protein
MSQKDGWFLGLLALAYLYVDSSPAPRAMSDDAFTPAPPSSEEAVPVGSRLLPVRVIPGDVCPRNAQHTVALRPDGAMWCRGCDEAFYPHATIWPTLTSAAA